MSTLSKEDQETLRLLVQHVLRAFYEPKFIVVMDQLARHPVVIVTVTFCARLPLQSLKDDDLAGRMGMQLKELNKVMAVLEKDKLVRIYRQNELKEGAQRSVGRQYFYIDYQHFCNVVKWRIAEMRRRIDNTLRNELDNKGYICPQCGKAFSPLEADKVMDFVAGTFNCDICRAELVDNEDAENVRGSQDRMQRFNRQLRFILQGLRKTEDMVLPAFDVQGWIKTHIIDAERAKTAAQTGGLKIAGASSDGKQEDSFAVVLTVDKDEATRRMERDKEAAAKRQQNALPAWHLKSTISGDLTALGVREHARAEEHAGMNGAAEKLPSSNDAILRGLGKAPQTSTTLTPSVTVTEDVKPDITRIEAADYYDQYYASLAASAAPSAQPTPAEPNLGSDFGDEEEDVKPSVEYLDSLNDYRKRSRSRDDVGSGGGPTKMARSEDGELVPAVLDDAIALAAAGEVPDDPLVYVGGEPMPFSQVTEEHQERMTNEEYTAYFEVYTARS